MTSSKPPPVELFRPADLDQDWGTLRATCPVSRTTSSDGADVWLVTRYHDIRTVLGGLLFAVSPIGYRAPEDGEGEGNESIFQDPPRHTRLRGLVAAPFAAGAVARYGASIRARAGALLEPMLYSRGPIDLMAEFSKPLTMNAICEVVGVPGADRTMFQELTDQLLVPLSETDGVVALEGWRQLNEYVRGLIDARRGGAMTGGDDLLAHLIDAQEQDSSLGDAELTTMVLGLPVAGYVSTANAILVAVRHLIQDRWLDELRRSPAGGSTLRLFVEEVLRIQSGDNGESMPRFAREDVCVGGATIRRGDMVVAPLVAANRDDELFERPDVFDPMRPGVARHVAFGHGIHRCLGANLARLELRCAVEAVVDSGIRLKMLEDWAEIPWSVNMLGDRFPTRLLVSSL